MTLRFMLGLALAAVLLLMVGAAIGYTVYSRKNAAQRRRRRRRKNSQAIRLDQFMVDPTKVDPD
jgi:hypothetical protein